MLQLLLAVFIGGGTGSVARWLLSMRFNPLHQAIPGGLAVPLELVDLAAHLIVIDEGGDGELFPGTPGPDHHPVGVLQPAHGGVQMPGVTAPPGKKQTDHAGGQEQGREEIDRFHYFTRQ